VATVLAFVLARWWTVPLGAAIWAAWVYSNYRSEQVHLGGRIDLFLGIVTTAFVTGALLAGLLIRFLVRRIARRDSVRADL
jgi:hypothetical protein